MQASCVVTIKKKWGLTTSALNSPARRYDDAALIVDNSEIALKGEERIFRIDRYVTFDLVSPVAISEISLFLYRYNTSNSYSTGLGKYDAVDEITFILTDINNSQHSVFGFQHDYSSKSHNPGGKCTNVRFHRYTQDDVKNVPIKSITINFRYVGEKDEESRNYLKYDVSVANSIYINGQLCPWEAK